MSLLTCVIYPRAHIVNSLAPGRCSCNLRSVIFKFILRIDILSIPCEIAVRWILKDFTDDKTILVQIMAWCHQATSHYLNQCWPILCLNLASLGGHRVKPVCDMLDPSVVSCSCVQMSLVYIWCHWFCADGSSSSVFLFGHCVDHDEWSAT